MFLLCVRAYACVPVSCVHACACCVRPYTCFVCACVPVVLCARVCPLFVSMPVVCVCVSACCVCTCVPVVCMHVRACCMDMSMFGEGVAQCE